jgi:acetyltransferase-like isoleucine patch superfamily enzyme
MLRQLVRKLEKHWVHFWMRVAGVRHCRRLGTWLAMLCGPVFFHRHYLANLNPIGFIAPGATIAGNVHLGSNVFIDDGVVIFQDAGGGPVVIGDRVRLQDHVHIQSGSGGSVTIGAGTSIQRGCQIEAYVAPINIGTSVSIAPRCAFYSCNHGFLPGTPISSQPLQAKGAITVDDGAWLGHGVIVLSGVRIGRGAVIGAGSTVTRDVPDGAVAVGVPARVVRMRDQISDFERYSMR